MFTDITPPQLHIHLLVLLSAGLFPTRTIGDPGAHGAAHAGTQGAGVGVPIAAAVAAITAGFAGQLHIPNVIGSFGISIIVASGIVPPSAVVCDVTVSGDGAAPNVHWHSAVLTAGFPITCLL